MTRLIEQFSISFTSFFCDSLTKVVQISNGSPTPSPGIHKPPSKSSTLMSGHNSLHLSGVTISHSIPHALEFKIQYQIH